MSDRDMLLYLNTTFQKLLPGEAALVRHISDYTSVNVNLQKISEAYGLQFPYVNSKETLEKAITILKSRLGM